jgi:site-specific recombinase XerC
VAFLIDADWDFYAIQRRLGHASIKTTFDIYGHLLGYGDEQHLSKLELRLPTAPPRDERRARPADPKEVAVPKCAD